MSKGDFIALYIRDHLTTGPLTVSATKAGRTVKLIHKGTEIAAQELSRGRVMHEVKTKAKDVIGTERRFRNGSAS